MKDHPHVHRFQQCGTYLTIVAKPGERLERADIQSRLEKTSLKMLKFESETRSLLVRAFAFPAAGSV